MTAEHLALVLASVAAAGAWAYMFVPPRRGVWPRTWQAAALLTTTAVIALVGVGRFVEVTGPVNLVEVAIGLGLGGAWLVATHIGYRVLAAMFPSFGDQVRDLYRIADGDRVSRMVGPVLAMGVAEEFLFRGVLQGVGGLVLGVAVYTGVQLFERNWTLVLAALLCGTVWGLLFWWRQGLVAPIVAHVLWTGMLTFVWTLGDEPAKVGPAAPETAAANAAPAHR